MKIIIEVENSKEFDIDVFMDCMNHWLKGLNNFLGNTYYAHYIGTEEEEDEND